MSLRKIALLAAGLFAGLFAASAQFYTVGDDPGSVRWSEARTPHYRLVYPRGMDSLARSYARELERFYPEVGRSAGYFPGERYRRPLPVVLHPFGGAPNGSVTWAPKRMDLFTLPNAYAPEPVPWEANLVVHESRHAAQMQFGADGFFRPFKWITGDLFAGAMAGVYPSTWMLEGDAVVAETALTAGGRGRSGAFTAYYRAAFDRGDWRNWYRWRYGSWRLYAPNHYALGYLTVAGARSLYDDAFFTADYLHGAAREPLQFFRLQRTFRTMSGQRFSEAFEDIMQMFHDLWTQDATSRGPFTEGRPTGPVPSWFTTWSAPAVTDSGILAKESSAVRATRLVTFEPDGQIRGERPFAESTGDLRTDGSRIYWSETVPDLRWSLKATSRIRYFEDGKIKDLTRKGRLYNPAPSPDGSRIAAAEYPDAGGSNLLLLDRSGRRVAQNAAPAGIQFLETAWVGKDLYFSFLEERGIGIGRWQEADLTAPYEILLEPQPVSLSHLQGSPDGIRFLCDRTGVGEVYQLTPGGTLIQLTATRYGATGFASRADTLFYTALSYEGIRLYRAAPAELLYRRADFHDRAAHLVAEKLTAQENVLRSEDPAGAALSDDPFVSGPKKHDKLTGFFHIHSWVPVWFDYDELDHLSTDILSRAAGIGATAFFQNLLGTASGQIGYHFRPAAGSGRQHSGHVKLTWSGLYPVFRLTLDAGDRNIYQYGRTRHDSEGLSIDNLTVRTLDIPSVRADLTAYVPLNFSRGGWNRGLIPQLRYSVSNDFFNKSVAVRTSGDPIDGSPTLASLSRFEPGRNIPMQNVTASVRAYATLRTPAAGEYPRWGLGIEGGYHTRVGLDDLFSSAVYAYVYGYLPGLMPGQGMRLTMIGQRQNGAPTGENIVSTLPRGAAGSQLSALLSAYAPRQLKVTADYSIPLYVGDISCFSPLFYIKHFVVKPRIDWLQVAFGRGQEGSASLLSAGAEVTARLANFLWLPYDTAVGFTFDWNGGPSYDRFNGMHAKLERTRIGGVFSISF